ncbi:COPIA protein, partial [Acromyrmex insinuator]
YRELIGGLVYLANATRPNIAFAANLLSHFSAKHLAKRILRYLKGTPYYRITYRKDKENLTAYTDSD